jgi:amino acid transporter
MRNRLLKAISRRQVYKNEDLRHYREGQQVNYNENDEAASNNAVTLQRKFDLITLTFLNISNSIGSGIYILTGMASNLYAGQYVSISYLFAGLACLLSAFCFAEFAARIKSSTGSAYSFVYFSMGELLAFVTGWLYFVGSLTSTAAASLTWSNYLDAAFDHKIKNFTQNTLHLKWDLKSPFTNYLDLPALFITILLFLISLREIRITGLFNNTLAILNITLLGIITVGGIIYGKIENLTQVKYRNGFEGIIKGTSVVMYAFFGFESSTFAIEEAINPSKNIPLSMIISLVVLNVIYCGASISLNLMQPFTEIDNHAAYPNAFKNVPFMHTIVTIGPIVSLMGTLVSTVYAIARVLLSMSKDGLVFKFLSRINPSTRVPDYATLVSGFLCIILIALIDVEDLIGFTDINGFLTYSLIAIGLLVLRYCGDQEDENISNVNTDQDIVESSLADENGHLARTNTLIQAENESLLQNTANFIDPRLIRRGKSVFFTRRPNAIYIIILIYLSDVILFGLVHNLKNNLVNMILTGFAFLFNIIGMVLLCFFDQIVIPNDVSFKVLKE